MALLWTLLGLFVGVGVSVRLVQHQITRVRTGALASSWKYERIGIAVVVYLVLSMQSHQWMYWILWTSMSAITGYWLVKAICLGNEKKQVGPLQSGFLFFLLLVMIKTFGYSKAGSGFDVDHHMLKAFVMSLPAITSGPLIGITIEEWLKRHGWIGKKATQS